MTLTFTVPDIVGLVLLVSMLAQCNHLLGVLSNSASTQPFQEFIQPLENALFEPCKICKAMRQQHESPKVHQIKRMLGPHACTQMMLQLDAPAFQSLQSWCADQAMCMISNEAYAPCF